MGNLRQFLEAALRTPPSLADRSLSVLHRDGRMVQRVIPISLMARVPVPANRHLEGQSRALVRVEQMGFAAGPVVPALIGLLSMMRTP